MAVIAPDVIKITGLRDLQRDLKAAGSDLPRAMRQFGKEQAQVVAVGAQGRAPVGPTGNLRRSVRAGGTAQYAYVRAGNAKVPYAGPIHFGWPAHHIKPNPFIYDEIDIRIEEVFAAYSNRLDALLRAHSL